jgi:hypothetical protein
MKNREFRHINPRHFCLCFAATSALVCFPLLFAYGCLALPLGPASRSDTEPRSLTKRTRSLLIQEVNALEPTKGPYTQETTKMDVYIVRFELARPAQCPVCRRRLGTSSMGFYDGTAFCLSCLKCCSPEFLDNHILASRSPLVSRYMSESKGLRFFTPTSDVVSNCCLTYLLTILKGHGLFDDVAPTTTPTP